MCHPEKWEEIWNEVRLKKDAYNGHKVMVSKLVFEVFSVLGKGKYPKRCLAFVYLFPHSDLNVEQSLDLNFISLICIMLVEFSKLQRIITATLLTDDFP